MRKSAFVAFAAALVFSSACGLTKSPTSPSPPGPPGPLPPPPGQQYEPIGEDVSRHYLLDGSGNITKYRMWVRLLWVNWPPGSTVRAFPAEAGRPPTNACELKMCFEYKMEFGMDQTPNPYNGMTVVGYLAQQDCVTKIVNVYQPNGEMMGYGTVRNGEIGIVSSGGFFRPGLQCISVEGSYPNGSPDPRNTHDRGSAGLYLGYITN